MMKHQKFIGHFTYLAILILGVIAGCQQQSISIPMDTSSTPLTAKMRTTPIPSPDVTPIPTLTALSTQYQLTFLSDCQENIVCMHIISIGCLDDKQPCIGEPSQIFNLAKRNPHIEPKPPVLSYEWSPNGLQVVIEAVGIGGKSDIFIGSWDGQNWVNLTNSQTYEGSPVWSPDGLSIAYIANSGEPNYYLRTLAIRLDNHKISPLLSALDFPSVGTLRWAPNGKRVAFARSDEQGYYQLFVANPDGSNLRQLTYEEKNHGLYGFSPDGQWLLYTQEIGTDFDNIYRIRFDGSEKVAITDDIEGFKTDLAWSPIGDWIAFTSNVKGSYDIYLIRSDGTGLLKVTESTIDEFAPAWRISP